MSVLSRIRHNMGLIVIVIGVAIVAFMFTDGANGLVSMFQRPPDAGSIAGQAITYNDFQDRVRLASQGQPTAGNDVLRGQLEDNVWDRMVYEMVLDKELENAGVRISSTEIYDMFAGEEMAPFLRDAIFGPNGEYNQEEWRQTLKNILQSTQPNSQQIQQLKAMETAAVRYRGEERYRNMISAAYLGSKALAKQKYEEQNKKVSISFLGVNYTSLNDSAPEFQVSDRDLNNYIKENDYKYKQEEETFIRYSMLPITPSVKDTNDAYKEITRLKNAFASYSTAEADSEYVSARSPFPFSPSSFTPLYRVAGNIQDQVAETEERGMIGPILEGSTYKVYKVSATQEAEKPSVKINHIQFNFAGDTSAAQTKARDIARQARGGADFAQLAQENSEDFQTRVNGGYLGWYIKGSYGADFDEAVENASVGSIVGPLKGFNGFHVVQIVDKSDKEYAISSVGYDISFSSATKDSVYGKANYFAQSLINTKDINSAGIEQGVNVLASPGLTKNSKDIPGLNGGRDVILWAINAEVGEYSTRVFRVNDTYVLAQVTDKKPEGLKSAEDVRDEIIAQVRNKKKADAILKKLKSLKGQDLNAMKDGYGEGAFINTAADITFQNPSISGIGQDKFIIGRVFGLSQGEISEPIAGDNGVYVIQVTAITDAPEADEATLTSSVTADRTTGGLSLSQKLVNAIIDLAEVEDSRHIAEARNKGYR